MKILGYKPDSTSDTFLKRLGAFTASFSTQEAGYGLASRIIAHEAIQRRKARELEKEEAFQSRINEFFRQRKEKGGSGHPDWWRTISRRIGIRYNQ